MAEHQEPLTYTVEETRKLLNIGRGSAYEAIRTGQIPSIRIGRRILVPRLGLQRLLDRSAEPVDKGDDKSEHSSNR